MIRLMTSWYSRTYETFLCHALKAHGGVDVQLHTFLISALDGVEWSASRPGHFTPR
jgi:hypothetical protein